MKIDLDDMTVFAIAERFAMDIYTERTTARLARVGVLPRRQFDGGAIPEIRRAVASITCPLDRSAFIRSIRFHFHRHAGARGSEPRWQDYVRHCAEAGQGRAA